MRVSRDFRHFPGGIFIRALHCLPPGIGEALDILQAQTVFHNSENSRRVVTAAQGEKYPRIVLCSDPDGFDKQFSELGFQFSLIPPGVLMVELIFPIGCIVKTSTIQTVNTGLFQYTNTLEEGTIVVHDTVRQITGQARSIDFRIFHRQKRYRCRKPVSTWIFSIKHLF